MGKLTIYKASAGSGKTFRLVAEYLKLIIDNPFNYRHILAVTFTNKATSEMKERVISELFKITNTETPSGMTNLISEETGMDFYKIKENAQTALEYILHDYGRFSVSTIDSFFQKVLRAFARETGLYGAYAVELDQDMVLEEACSRLLDSVSSNKALHNWLLQMSENQMEQGQNWRVNRAIFNFGKEIFKESFYPYISKIGSEEDILSKISSVRKQIFAIKSKYESDCKEYGKQGLATINHFGLSIDKFSYGEKGFAAQFKKLADTAINFDKFGKRFTDAINNCDKWYSSKSEYRASIIECYNNGQLNGIMNDVANYVARNSKKYHSAMMIEENLFVLGIVSSLVDKIREIGQENNTLLLSEGIQIIKGIIGENDAPFIYEKVGNNFTNYMIDEFQDTSTTQWANFKPLVNNSLSENNSNLIVGDVKQSIYRWRNGDWRLLNSKISEDLKQFRIELVSLNSNWRSSKNIVSFNNAFFEKAPVLIQEMFNAQLPDNGNSFDEGNKTLIKEVYADTKQTANSKIEGGKVELCFIEAANKNEYEAPMLSHLIDTIKELQDKGVKAKDIAILIRENKNAAKIASAIIAYSNANPTQKYNFDLISYDALLVSNAISVKFLVSLANYVATPSDQILKASLIYDFSHYILPKLNEKSENSFTVDINGNQINTEDIIKNDVHSIIDENTKNSYFPFFDLKGMGSVPSQWISLPVNELISTFISTYKLNLIEGEQANIQAFKDLIFDFGKKEPLTLHKMLAWWNDKGIKCKLQTSGDRDAIKITTIHKSKGLEFPYVIIPYCNWDLGIKRKDSIIWCNTEGSDFSDLPVVPIKIKTIMADTIFEKDYYSEMMLSCIDNLNILYVAMTRAVNGLYIFASGSSKEIDPLKISGENDLFQAISPETLGLIKEESETPYTIYSMGNIATPHEEINSVANEKELYANKSFQEGYASKLKIRVNYDDFLSTSSGTESKINKGKCLHNILSAIETASDIPQAVQMAIESGSIKQSESENIRTKIETMISNPIAADWFNGKMKIINETAILEPTFQLRRPDRVMIGQNEIIVVDYKSGKRNASHKKQITDYMGLIKSSSSKEVSGYIWYINENEIVAVN